LFSSSPPLLYTPVSGLPILLVSLAILITPVITSGPIPTILICAVLPVAPVLVPATPFSLHAHKVNRYFRICTYTVGFSGVSEFPTTILNAFEDLGDIVKILNGFAPISSIRVIRAVSYSYFQQRYGFL
jgi:hypothetical protein